MSIYDHSQETDTIYSRGKLYPWIVEVKPHAIQAGHKFPVLADSADHACAYVCDVHWIARTSLRARPADAQ
jgi:hypothetical protein